MSSEFFRLTPIKSTRKPHRCECCGTIFSAGSEMLSYAGMFEGEFCHFYYCAVCDDLYRVLGWDWSEGIQQAEEALADEGVIASIKCPYAASCDNEHDEYDIDFTTGKINFSCECPTGENLTWEADIRDAARAFKEREAARHAV